MNPSEFPSLDLGPTIRGFAPGQTVFGRFTLQRLLGRGGMGVVWLATDTTLEWDVALKFVSEGVAGDTEAVGDLKRETLRALALTHPRIVRIFDFHRQGLAAAISMEYVDGSSLTALKLDQPERHFEVAGLLPVLEQLCAALTYAHEEAGVVHRDLKPANLMLNSRGELKVADFGIAASISESTTRVSNRGTSGTPAYMSPQQLRGEKPAPADDIYSLGATLYELLAGKPPFGSGDIHAQVLQRVPPSIAERREELGLRGEKISPAWEETIAACLAKDPKDRPPSAGKVWARLQVQKVAARNQQAEVREQKSPDEPAPGAGRASPKSKGAFFAAMVAVVVALAGAGYYFGVYALEQKRLAVQARREAAEEKRRAEAKAAEEARLKAEQEKAAKAAEAARIAALNRPKEGQSWTLSDLKLTLMPIAAGTFTMGSSSDEPDRGLDEVQRRVTISRPFWLGRTEVTQRQWQAVMGSNPSYFKGADLPVEQVRWDEAMEFCRRLTERERAAGRLPAGYAYTLPTEAQWEYACRAGTTGGYAGSGLDAMGWYNANSGDTTHAAGGKQANEWGLHDMHGNVYEWCLDWYGRYPGGSVTDPAGASSGSYRVYRGGGWSFSADRCRSAYRSRTEPGFRAYYLGFRFALSSVR